jgi:hypothetical protein
LATGDGGRRRRENAVRVLEPSLLRAARPARFLLAADVAIGVATALLVLVQATLLARVVTRAFGGATAGAVAG